MILDKETPDNYHKGRGAQFNPHNRFAKNDYVKEHDEGIDEWEEEDQKTTFIFGKSKSIVNKVDSPDVGMAYSLNPYQGCEHGCTYCYARNTHEYWGYSAGLDFERKIIIKHNAPEALAAQLENPKWRVLPLMLAGNTDCYQPIEQKMQLTRRMLQVLLEYRHPVSIITKNALILRDLDILTQLDKLNLLHVNI